MSKRLAPQLPEQPDLFFVDVADVSLKDAREVMTLPFLSLSKRPRFKPIEYAANDNQVTVTGGAPFGIATIWDFDIMLWLFGQVRLQIKQGQEPSRYIGFSVHECLIGIKRATGKKNYQQLEAALLRLMNTRIFTNVGNDKPTAEGCGWLDNVKLHRHPNGRLHYVEVWINEWMFNKVIDETQILTVHPNYFLLTGGIEKFLYRTARKMAGRQPQGWTISMDELYARSGVDDREHFVSQVRKVAGYNDHPTEALPEYRVLIERRGGGRQFTEMVTFKPREYVKPIANKKPLERGAADHRYYAGALALSDDARDEALAFCRKHDLDFGALFKQWQTKQQKGKGEPIKSPGRAFMGYLQGVAKRQRQAS